MYISLYDSAIAYCLLLIAYCLLLIVNCLLLIEIIAYCLLLLCLVFKMCYRLLTYTYYFMLITYCLLLIAYWLLFILPGFLRCATDTDATLCLLLIAYCLLLIAYFAWFLRCATDSDATLRLDGYHYQYLVNLHESNLASPKMDLPPDAAFKAFWVRKGLPMGALRHTNTISRLYQWRRRLRCTQPVDIYFGNVVMNNYAYRSK
jgi:hypothetical protein